jgi:hypothetical protein
MSVLQDILSEDLSQDRIRILVKQGFNEAAYEIRQNRESELSAARSKTLGKAKSLLEFYDLVDQAIEMHERRASVPEQYRVRFTQEEPDFASETETISFGLVKREPGCFSQGAPFQGSVRNLRPLFREIRDDPENPGYQQLVTGYWYENIVQFTCWAKTNKVANARAIWLEDLMEEYAWWFTMQGTQRAIFWGQEKDKVMPVNENKWYGRPINYFIKTERLRVLSEKTLEEIIVKLVTKRQ